MSQGGGSGKVFSVQYSVFSVQYSVFSIQYSVFSVQCSVFSIQCSVFSVQAQASCPHDRASWTENWRLNTESCPSRSPLSGRGLSINLSDYLSQNAQCHRGHLP